MSDRPARRPAATDATRAGPLTGIRVLDLSAYIAGPYGCTLLADQGAEVIKIEPPDGDNLRKYPSTLRSESRAFLGVNRSKRGVVLDLKQPDGPRRAAASWSRSADVLVHNFRPGVPDAPRHRLRRSCSALNPRLIYCAVTGYGEQRPAEGQGRLRPGAADHDAACARCRASAAARPRSCTARWSTTTPPRCVAARRRFRAVRARAQRAGPVRRRLAAAQRADDAVGAHDLGRGRAARRRARHALGRHHRPASRRAKDISTSRRIRRTSGRRCASKTGLAELADDARYDTVRKRAAARGRDRAEAARGACRRAPRWNGRRCSASEVPCAAARTVEDMFDHPQVLAEDMIAHFEHPAVGSYRGLKRAIRFGAHAGPRPVRGAGVRPGFGRRAGAKRLHR